MSLDSGIPDYLDNTAFWRDFPEYKPLALEFDDMEDVDILINKEENGVYWGFHETRRRLMAEATPGVGYVTLLEWMKAGKIKDWFVVTSNRDGLFEKAGKAVVLDLCS